MTLEEKIVGMLTVTADTPQAATDAPQPEPIDDEGERLYRKGLYQEAIAHWKKAAAGIGTKKVSFAKPEAVLDQVGCEVGCVPPFGQMAELPIYMDPELSKKDYVYFNPGVHDKSFKIKAWDLKKVANPKMI